MQSSKSKLQPVWEKGVCSDSDQATLDGSEQKLEQKLGKDVWHDSASITTKIYNQIGNKWNAMFENHVKTCIYWRSFDLKIWRFFEQYATQINHLLCYWQIIHNSILILEYLS